MKYEYWKKFASKQNGQNIRLRALLKRVKEERELSRRFVIGKIESALEANDELKHIVEEDYYANKPE